MLELDGVLIQLRDFQLSADISVEAGGVAAIVGESGAGKSTLFAALSGFQDLAAGSISWNGRFISDLPPDQRPVSILFQDNNLFPHLTLHRNVALGLTTRRRLTAEVSERVDEALSQVGLSSFGNRRPGELSGGQRSRAALARALVRERPLVLLDEPFAALGPAMKVEMLDLTASVMANVGATVLMITHDPQDAQRIAGRTIVVDSGVVRAPVPTDQLFANPPAALRRYFGKE